MPKESLTSRVVRLEKIVAELVTGASPTRESLQKPGRDEWMKVVGMFDGDEGMKRIVERGAAIRRAERREARKR